MPAPLPPTVAQQIDDFTDATADPLVGFHTAATFKARYSDFAALDDDTVNAFIQEALMYVDTSWPNPFRLKGHGLAIAHLLKMENYGTTTSATPGIQLPSLNGVQSFAIDDMSVTLGSTTEEMAAKDHFNATMYGRQFLQLRNRIFGGGLVV